MRKIIALILSGISLLVFAEDIYVVRTKPANEGESLWTTYAQLPIEAVSAYTPTYFTKNGSSVSYKRSFDFSFSTDSGSFVINLSSGALYKYSVKIEKKKALPKAKKIVTIEILLKELGTGALYSESPGLLALHKAILRTAYKSGWAWINSVYFDNKNMFKISVAFTDKL